MTVSRNILDEVVVTGITSTDKRLFTGATSKIDAEKMNIAGVAEVGRSLEGKVSGVSVQNVSGTFGVAPKIRVRGATSIFGSSKPLWVVDGRSDSRHHKEGPQRSSFRQLHHGIQGNGNVNLPTWNISGAWNTHEEKWFRSLKTAVSNLTLRLSYSFTADSGPANVTNSNVVIASGTPWKSDVSLQESALYIVNLANKDLTYEKKKEFNIGANIGFLDNRINIESDYFLRDNFDLIGIINTQGVGGEIRKYGNVASMESSGAELSLSTINIRPSERGGFAKEGYPVRSLFSIPYEGLNS